MKCVAALSILFLGAGRAQDSASITLDNGVHIKIAADFGHPTGQENLTVQMARAGGNSIYRIFRDQNDLAVYAYELVFNLTAGGSAVLADAKPYDEQFISQFPYADSGKPTPTLSDEQPLPVSAGNSAELHLFEIPGMGLQVSETISIEIDRPSRGGPLRFSDLQVSINGSPVAGAQQLPVSGRFVMFYIPGHGGYFFSTDNPGHGFMKAGVVDGDRMQFSADNDQFECVAAEPILTRSGSGEVWVFHDPNYKPAGNWTLHQHTQSSSSPAEKQFFTAAADSLNWWLP